MADGMKFIVPARYQLILKMDQTLIAWCSALKERNQELTLSMDRPEVSTEVYLYTEADIHPRM